MDHCLDDFRFRSLKPDPCVYIYEDEIGFVIQTLCEGDFLLFGLNKLLLNKLKKQLMYRFERNGHGRRVESSPHERRLRPRKGDNRH